MTGIFSRTALTALAAMAAIGPAIAQDQPGHPVPFQIHLQPSVTPIMDSIVAFHDGILLWTAILITLLVLALLVIVMVRFNAKRNPTPSTTTHNTFVEVAWTVLPIVVLIVIAIPSFGVLADQLTLPDGERKYLGSNIFSFGDVEVPPASLTIKAIGQQWYWDYEYMDSGSETITSILLPEEARLAMPEASRPPRLLGVDNFMVVPVDTTVRLLVTADPGGVIHAFAVPSFGVKIDAVPGRLNETWFNVRETGIYYGQCSELCGQDHAYMPIGVRVVTQEEYAVWVAAFESEGLDEANATLPAV